MSTLDFVFALLSLVAMVGCGGCRDGASDGAAPMLVVSGDTEGWIVPCGCASKQFGGLPRRATCAKRLALDGNDLLLVDVGGAAADTSPYDRLRFEAIARGEVLMGTAAHNIGASEAALGPEVLREIAEQTALPLVSANVRDRKGNLLAEPFRMMNTAGRRIAVIGVLGPQYATPQIDVAPPRAAVLETMTAIDETCDTVVVLAYLPEDALREFAETLPEVDLIVGGPTGQPIRPTRIGPTLLASATNQGKFLAVFSRVEQQDAQGWNGRIVELDESHEDDPGQLENLKHFYALLRQHDFRPEETSFVASLPQPVPAGFAVAGMKRCIECHEEEYVVWRDSRHRHAWESLEKKGAHVDPECQRCHVTGYGMPSGYTSLAQGNTRVNVGCESCHGPSMAHCNDEKNHTSYYGQAKNHCQSCHDRENSPEFDFKTYWAKIQHGPEKADDTATKPTGEKSL